MASIRGRVVARKPGEDLALEEAEVRLVGFWRSPVPAHQVVRAAPPHLAHLTPRLASDRPRGCSVRAFLLSLPPGPSRLLLESTLPKAKALRLSDVQGLAPGDLLLLDPQDPERAEYLPVNEVTPRAQEQRPGMVKLAQPAVRPHRAGAAAQKAVPQGEPGQACRLAEPAAQGDACLFLDGLEALWNAGAALTVQISGGAFPPEVHRLEHYLARSGEQGYYRLPPIWGVAQVELEARASGRKPVRVIFSPDYEREENVVDFIFR